MDSTRKPDDGLHARALLLVVLLILAGFVLNGLIDGIWGKEVTVYPVACDDVRSRTVCQVIGRTTYKVFTEQQRVVYWSEEASWLAPSVPTSLLDCVVRNKMNWVCRYPDGSGTVSMVGGKLEEPEPRLPGLRYIGKWRYWKLRLGV